MKIKVETVIVSAFFLVCAALILFVFTCNTKAGTKPAPSAIDTVSLNAFGKVDHFECVWHISCSNNAVDTLISPIPGATVLIVHKGATTGDTLLFSFGDGSKPPHFSGRLTTTYEAYNPSWPNVSAPAVTRVYLKGKSSSFPVDVIIRQ